MAGTIRTATLADVDIISNISIAATTMDESFVYRFPYRDQYPDDFAGFIRARYENALANEDGRQHLMIYEHPTDPEDPTQKIPIAFSHWTLPAATSTANAGRPPRPAFLDPTPENPRRDVKPDRVEKLHGVIGRMNDRLFQDVYGPEHVLILGMLMCHPDWQRRGAGRALVEWGVRKTRGEGEEGQGDNKIKAISLFASPIGEKLYRSLGFRQAGEVERVQIEGEEEFVNMKGMVLEMDS